MKNKKRLIRHCKLFCIIQSVNREEDRWQQIENKRNEEDEYARRQRDDGMASKKNSSNVSYDILSLAYNQDTGGEQQKYSDDMGKWSKNIKLL